MLDAATGELDRAEAALREAAEKLRHIEAPFLLGRCLHHLAALLVQNGAVDEAQQLISEADELFQRLGADAWLERNATLIQREAVA
jgi:tetratricopeptide (TPR) repeat protein